MFAILMLFLIERLNSPIKRLQKFKNYRKVIIDCPIVSSLSYYLIGLFIISTELWNTVWSFDFH